MRQYLLFGIGIAIWLVGGQLLTARYYRRIGRTWRPLDVPRFNGREWTILTVLAIVGLTFIALAIAPSKS